MGAERALPGRAPVDRRWWVLGSLALAGAAAAWALGLSPAGLVPRGAGWDLLGDLVEAALSPALRHGDDVPPGTAPLALRVAGSLWTTLLYAAAAMSLALPVGLGLGLLGSDAFWTRGFRPGGGGIISAPARSIQVLVRAAMALLRSVHELIWALLFLAAFGLAPASGVFAIALPFSGTIAKVSSELLDEAPREGWRALGLLGAGRMPALMAGLVPGAVPDVLSYGFYRFECALRSAAVLGFFGAPTVGTYVRQAFEEQRLHSMWSYLYGLMAMVLVFEWLGARLRRSLR